ncbi:MAG TPA: hypothetical protein VM619_05880 [Luteimonas sp.]|nr:hypothetical protein [Luteimonas sp.]
MDIRTFLSFEEIVAEPAYRSSNGVNEVTYESLVGHYTFQDDVHCCYLNSTGNLCNEAHKFGFVVRLKDQSLTIVGNSCAATKFGADSSLRMDTARYNNEKRRRERLAELTEILESRDAYERRLDACLNAIKDVKSNRDEFLSHFGNGTVSSLHDMARTGQRRVVATAVSYRKHTYEDGYVEKERTTNSVTIGTLNGLNAILESTYSLLVAEAKQIKQQLAEAEAITREAKQTTIDRVVTSVRRVSSLEASVADLSADFAKLSNSDAGLFCYLVPDKSERIRAARYALLSRNQGASRDNAKSWLSQQDSVLARSFGADKIEV